MLNRPVEEVHALLDAQTHRRIIKTHTPLEGVPFVDEVHYVIVGRDPRDVANLDLGRLSEPRATAVDPAGDAGRRRPLPPADRSGRRRPRPLGARGRGSPQRARVNSSIWVPSLAGGAVAPPLRASRAVRWVAVTWRPRCPNCIELMFVPQTPTSNFRWIRPPFDGLIDAFGICTGGR